MGGLIANFSKFEAFCGLKSINLTTDNIKIVGVHFSYSDSQQVQSTKQVQNNTFDTVQSIQQVLHFWNSRIFLLEGRTGRAISKIIYHAFFTVIPNSMIEELQKLQKTFLWHSLCPKNSHKTVCKNFENGEQKYIDT